MKSPSIFPENGRLFGINWQAADEVSVASCGHRDKPNGRMKRSVLLRLANSATETGLNMSISRIRARQIAIALAQASGMEFQRPAPFRRLPKRLSRLLTEHTSVENRSDLVLIWSGEHHAYWRPEASGYTSRATKAGIYTREVAISLTSHCGPEKRIELEPLPSDWLTHKGGAA
ncbi:hypothetical protein [Novosphingobium sp. KN65.2]|uniref:hypothetical protein n=1 Tax=Novosphingobium sp. KN65.2 TaxID=1478134 RepID=UPI0005E5E829|nr:hypothetical protein [Novosphingobium sp. KN65.2]CDO35795.1 hypothetical protein SPHV1_2270141 [Novosphingobium sp. KN65.2]